MNSFTGNSFRVSSYNLKLFEATRDGTFTGAVFVFIIVCEIKYSEKIGECVKNFLALNR